MDKSRKVSGADGGVGVTFVRSLMKDTKKNPTLALK